MRVLLVEDDDAIGSFIEAGLRESGYAVDRCGRGDDALDWLDSVTFDAIILDVMLPGRDGFAIAREARARGVVTPILMLTARDTVDDRVRGLDSGADDYLVKPFAFAELLARLRALSRRQPALQDTVLRIADLEVDTAARTVSRGGQPIPLGNKDYAILEYMVRNAGQVLTRAMIAERVWDYSFDPESNIIDVHIRYLRRKIDEPFERKLIQTVRGAGYRIAADPS